MSKVKAHLPPEMGGTVVITIRDGESPEQAVQRRVASITAMQAETPSAASDSDFQNLAAGLAQGVSNVGRQVGNMAQLDQLGFDAFSDEAIAERSNLDEDLLDTKAGFTGSLIGEIGATLPLGLGGGALAAKAIPSLGKTLARRAAMQGATEGAIVGGPDNRLGGAALGAGIGGVGAKAAQGLSRTLGARGKGVLGKITDDAAELQDEIDEFIPLSQAMPEGSGGKSLYEGIISNLPIAGGTVRGQRIGAVQAFNREAAERSLPPPSIPGSPTLLPDDIPIEESMSVLQKSWDDAWDLVKGYDVTVPTGFKPPAASVQKGLKEFDIAWPRPGQVLKTDELLTLRSQLQELANSQSGQLARSLRGQAVAAKNQVDDMLGTFFGKTDSVAPKAWRGLMSDEGKSAFNKFLDLQKAAPGNVSRKITPATIETASAKRAGKAGLEGEGALQEFGSKGAQVLTDFPSKQGIFQMGAAMGLLRVAGTPFGMALGPKWSQKMLTGQLNSQKAIQEFVTANEDLLRRFGLLGRAGAVSLAVEE